MGMRPASPSMLNAVLEMKPQWLYRIENFTLDRFGQISPMQICLTNNSRVIPMPSDLKIKIPFKPKPFTNPHNVRVGEGVDVEGILLSISGSYNNFTMKIRDKFDQYFLVDCLHSNPGDKEMAESFIQKTVLVRNSQYSKYEATGNHHVEKRFHAIRCVF